MGDASRWAEAWLAFAAYCAGRALHLSSRDLTEHTGPASCTALGLVSPDAAWLSDGPAGIEPDEHRRMLREVFAAHGGREIDTQGDSFFYAFPRAKQAIAAAIDAQRALADHVWAGGIELRVRMGVHSGEPLVGEDTYVGIGVNRAARIGAAAHGGQVLESDATRALVEDDLPQGVYLRELSLFRLKDIDRPERISQVTAEGLPSTFPALRGAEPVKGQPVLRRHQYSRRRWSGWSRRPWLCLCSR